MVCFRKCVRANNGVHFLDIATPKSGPNLSCFNHVVFEMCFAPPRRALFRIELSRSDPALVCLILTWKCASRHNGMQFSSLFSQLTPLWRAYFSSGPQIMENPMFRDFPPFRAMHLLSSESCSSTLSYLNFLSA